MHSPTTAPTSSTPGARRARLNPLVRRRRRGQLLLGRRTAPATSTSPASSSTSTSATSTPSWSRRSRSRPTGCARSPRSTPTTPRSEAARLIAEVAAEKIDRQPTRHGVLHQRRRRGHRERHAHGPAAHRPAQGAHHLPQLPRRHRRGDHADRRPAPLAERAGHARRRQVLGAVPVPLRVPRDRARPRSASGRSPTSTTCSWSRAADTVAAIIARDGRRHQRHPRAARRLPRRRARAVRPARHRDDLRRGDGRLRPLRRVVRGRPLGRAART